MNKKQLSKLENNIIKTGVCLNQIEHDTERRHSAIRKTISDVFEEILPDDYELVVSISCEHIEVGNNYFGIFVYDKYKSFKFEGRVCYLPYEDNNGNVGLKFIDVKERNIYG